ncbi:MAG: ArsR/SmtB family transcription factor [Rhodospirillaceae bacterium]
MTATASQMTKPFATAEDLERLQSHVSAAARLMKLMASEQRLMLLCRLGEGECSVTELADYAKLAQSAASQHLARLRGEGVVETRRDGQTIYYRLSDAAAIRVIDTLCDIYKSKRRSSPKRKNAS